MIFANEEGICLNDCPPDFIIPKNKEIIHYNTFAIKFRNEMNVKKFKVKNVHILYGSILFLELESGESTLVPLTANVNWAGYINEEEK